MKQTLQLRLGQHLTMTPQLQQAIRLLQLSTLDLRQEIQEALESNLMLEADEELAEGAGLNGSGPAGEGDDRAESASAQAESDREVDGGRDDMPDELPVDSSWDDVYDAALPPASSLAAREHSGSDFLAQRSSAATLSDHLVWQMNLTPFSEIDRAIATTIIDGISEDGYLRLSVPELVQSIDIDEVGEGEVEAVLHRVQQFDPPGVGARSPQECLLLQLLQHREPHPLLDKAVELVRDHFELLVQHEVEQLKRRLKIDDEALASISELIRSLNPRPGTAVEESTPQYVVPDVFVYRKGGAWHVELNPEATPRLRVNPDYARLVRRADTSEQNTYLKNHLQEARWFIKSLVSRNETLLRVATKIVEFQRGFFEHGEEAMKPLVLRDVAEALEMHESTISRITTQKYMHTPRGTLEFKYFFSSHVSTAGGGECSATAIRALIKKMIAAEPPRKPLSDNKIASLLADQGIKVARRTVAKYRESMAIPPSNERKRIA